MRQRSTALLARSSSSRALLGRLSVALFFGALFFGSSSVSSASTPSTEARLEQATSELSLGEIQERAKAVAARASLATVGLKIGRNLGSGVIVSESGIVITAGHVVEAPGQTVEVTLSDGTVVLGKTLGVNRWIDSGMLKIDGDGPWPYLELGSETDLNTGDWVLALGHPGGVELNRPPVVRFGRVASNDARVIRTDCTIVSGDSGGPLVDLEGRVVGIHTSLRPVLVANDHLPVDTFRRTWEQLLSGKSWGGSPSGRAILGVKSVSVDGPCLVEVVVEGMAADLAGLRVGDIITGLEGESISGGYAELEQRISERYVGEPVQVEVARDSEQLKFHVRLSRYEKGDPVRIVETPWSYLRRPKNESSLMRSFRRSVRAVEDSVASIVCNGRRVALGSVFSADGKILTKASELSGEITCWINGHSYAAELIGVDRAFDLALLQIEASNLKPVSFEERELELGQWLITPDASSKPVAVGILSVLPRAIPVRSGFLGVKMLPDSKGVRITMVVENSSAQRAGLRRGDILTKVNGVSGLTNSSVRRVLRSIRPNSDIQLEFLRAGTVMRALATLSSHPEEERNPVELQNRQAGPISSIRSGFPLAFYHDTVLAPNECGGPIVDLEGRAIGINLARAGRTSSYGVHSAELLEVVAAIETEALGHSAIPKSVIR